MATSRKRGATRRSREPLSRERIVEAALALIDEQGLAAFSTRKLGERLGCQAMSIYHHFPSKQHLLDALVDHAMASIDTEPVQPEPIEPAAPHAAQLSGDGQAISRALSTAGRAPAEHADRRQDDRAVHRRGA
jgi:AcrR family transcriptional regulator